MKTVNAIYIHKTLTKALENTNWVEGVMFEVQENKI